MKRKRRKLSQQSLSASARRRTLGWTFSLLSSLSTVSVLADETSTSTNAPPQLTPEQMFEGGETTYTNWVEFSAGGFFTSGDKARQQQRQQRPASAFGGIEDCHYHREVATNTVMSLDGRGIFDKHDYKLRLDVTREKVGYLRFNYSEFRTWYDGDGGFDPSSNS